MDAPSARAALSRGLQGPGSHEAMCGVSKSVTAKPSRSSITYYISTSGSSNNRKPVIKENLKRTSSGIGLLESERADHVTDGVLHPSPDDTLMDDTQTCHDAFNGRLIDPDPDDSAKTSETACGCARERASSPRPILHRLRVFQLPNLELE